MLLSVATTFAATSALPFAAGLTTGVTPFGQDWFSAPSASAPQVLLPTASFLLFSLANSPVGLIRPRYFLNMCVVPDESKRTTRVIGVSALQPVPESLSPLSVISLHLFMLPHQISS